MTINDKTLDLLNTEIGFLPSIEEKFSDLSLTHQKYKLKYISQSLDTISDAMLYTFNRLKKKYDIDCWHLRNMHSKIRDEIRTKKTTQKPRRVNITADVIKNPIQTRISPPVDRNVVEKK